MSLGTPKKAKNHGNICFRHDINHSKTGQTGEPGRKVERIQGIGTLTTMITSSQQRLGQQLCLLLVLAGVSTNLFAKIYYYRAPDGSLMVSDHVINDPAYTLTLKKDTLDNAGYILANRAVPKFKAWKFQRHINGASSRYGVDPALVEAIIQVESAFNPDALSVKGAGGLMQLMSKTAKRYRVKDRFDPKQNIYGGVQHLKYLMNRFDSKLNLVLAAYNAGSSAVDKYGGIPPYPETRRYIAKVKSAHNRIRTQQRSLVN